MAGEKYAQFHSADRRRGSGRETQLPRETRARDYCGRRTAGWCHCHQDDLTGDKRARVLAQRAGQGDGGKAGEARNSPAEGRAQTVSRAVGGALAVLGCPLSARSQEWKGKEGRSRHLTAEGLTWD